MGMTIDDTILCLKGIKKEMALLKFVGKCQDVVQQKIDAFDN